MSFREQDGTVSGQTADPVMLRIMLDTLASIPEEMGRALKRTAYSQNIKERMDASCALFDPNGELLAQAEHIPVHLGSLPLVVRKILEVFPKLDDGDLIVVNDPEFGGTHLPDITTVLPVFIDDRLCAFVVSRAHHADIGGMAPGSMPAASDELFQEGLIIPLVKVMRGGKEVEDVLKIITANTRTPEERLGDLRAQFSSCFLGRRRYLEMIERYGLEVVEFYEKEVKKYSRRLTRERLQAIPNGTYLAVERIDLDRSNGLHGISEDEVCISVTVRIEDGKVSVDFSDTDDELVGNHNAPMAVTYSAVHYVFRCITGADVPNNEGCLRDIEVIIPDGCLLNPSKNRGVCSGNVETSQRIVEVLFSALNKALPDYLPAGSQATMNNLIIGGRDFSYYETLGGGEGGYSWRNGESGIHTHMTNTANTPVEAIELSYPLLIRDYSLVEGSGGKGLYRGGEGIRRSITVLAENARLSILSGNRRFAPHGRQGGGNGRSGRNVLLRDGREIGLAGLADIDLKRGDVVIVETPGGGGWGRH